MTFVGSNPLRSPDPEPTCPRPLPNSVAISGELANNSFEANSSVPQKAELEKMARRRFQNPRPQKRGAWWTLRVYRDVFKDGQRKRQQQRIRLAPATMPVREVQKVAVEYLRPMNQGLQAVGSATPFNAYVNDVYKPVVLPTMAKSTQERYLSVIKNYLTPTFGGLCLRDITPLNVQRYFSAMASSKLSRESRDKIRDVLSSILGSAVKPYGLLVKNPCESIKLPLPPRGRRRHKPFLYRHQFDAMLGLMQEPYASMVFVAIFTGLRVSELAALKWGNVHSDSITIDERFCRGDWSQPKSEASNATIPVNRDVIERIQRLKELTVTVNWGGHGAHKQFRAVRKSEPEDLVFQSLRKGAPMRDNNILVRHIKPAARKLGLEFVNWQVMRRSFATWLNMAGVNVKDAQALMRHAHAATTQDTYQQFVPESQRRAVDRLSSLGGMVQ